MKLLIVVIFALAVATCFVDAQPSVVGFWGGELCESFTVNNIPLRARRTFEATESHYTLTLGFFLGECGDAADAIVSITAAGPYQFVGTGTAEGCTVQDAGLVYNVDLYTNETKEFLFTLPFLNSTVATLCPWPNGIPKIGVPYDIRDLDCPALSIASCESQHQIVQLVTNPNRLYFGPASVTDPNPCEESARPTIVTDVAFIKDLQTANTNKTTCFATPSSPVTQPISAPVASDPVGVPLNNNVNPVSAATNSQTRFIAILGFFVALVLATL
jgi:hypothetical protein